MLTLALALPPRRVSGFHLDSVVDDGDLSGKGEHTVDQNGKAETP